MCPCVRIYLRMQNLHLHVCGNLESKLFVYVCKLCIYMHMQICLNIYAKFAHVSKSVNVYAFTHICKIYSYVKVGKFAPVRDLVQMLFAQYYANFAYMQIWLFRIMLNKC